MFHSVTVRQFRDLGLNYICALHFNLRTVVFSYLTFNQLWDGNAKNGLHALSLSGDELSKIFQSSGGLQNRNDFLIISSWYSPGDPEFLRQAREPRRIRSDWETAGHNLRIYEHILFSFANFKLSQNLLRSFKVCVYSR